MGLIDRAQSCFKEYSRDRGKLQTGASQKSGLPAWSLFVSRKNLTSQRKRCILNTYFMSNASAPESTLYEQLGGEAAVNAAVDVFYRKVLTDDRVSHFFDDVDMDRQIAKQKGFLTMVFGGPVAYTGQGHARRACAPDRARTERLSRGCRD